MHYYQFNIADYRKDTVHLSRLEHSIYRDLIDWYYLDESPIPKETQVVSRRLRLGSEEEAGALQNVLSDFFEEREDGYYHDRIEQEIASYHEMAEKNKKNGKKGGRPPKLKPKGNPEETEKNPVGSQSVASGNPNESQKNPNQEPLTNNQEPIVLESSKDDLLPDKPGSVTPLCPHQKIVDLYHEILPELPPVRDITEQRQKTLRARWRSQKRFQNLDWWRDYFEAVSERDFLMGRTKDWQANFDFLITANKFQKIIEGGYQNGSAAS